MITTPEQMREAAAQTAKSYDLSVMSSTNADIRADQIAAAIRAIPIAPQPDPVEHWRQEVGKLHSQVARLKHIVVTQGAEMERRLARAETAEAALAAPQPVAVTVLPIELAPRDSTMLWLLVDYSGDGHNPLEDAIQAWTIGFNSLTDTDVDKWEFAGWSWEQDCFTQGYGEVIGWRHLDVHIDPSATPASAHVDDLATTAPQPAAPLSDPRVKALVEAARDLADDVVEYGRINQLGDGEQEHNIKRVRTALRAIGGEA